MKLHSLAKVGLNLLLALLGTSLTSFGGKGSGPWQFDHAIAIAVANDGSIFAVDFANNRIEKWTSKKS